MKFSIKQDACLVPNDIIKGTLTVKKAMRSSEDKML